MAITYNAGTNTITVTGYTEATPCNFTDIYNADVAGAWGKVTRQCTNQFCFTAKLIIGDGSTATWFADVKKDIRFSGVITSTWAMPLDVLASAHFRLGILVDDSKKITKYGCSLSMNDLAYRYIFIGVRTNCYLEIYDSKLNAGSQDPTIYDSFIGDIYSTQSPNLVKVYNTLIENSALHRIVTNLTVYNMTVETGKAGIYSAFGDIDKTTLNGMTHRYIGLSLGNGGTFKNLVCRGSPTYDIYVTQTSVPSYFINCDFDRAWLFHWDKSPYPTVYRQYEFDLKVIDKDNVPINAATVKVWDKDSNLIVDTTTNASGVIATQTITRGYYNQANGNTLQEASPHLIKIEKAGYTTYEADFTLEDKTDWLIALQTASILRNPPMTGGMV